MPRMTPAFAASSGGGGGQAPRRGGDHPPDRGAARASARAKRQRREEDRGDPAAVLAGEGEAASRPSHLHNGEDPAPASAGALLRIRPSGRRGRQRCARDRHRQAETPIGGSGRGGTPRVEPGRPKDDVPTPRRLPARGWPWSRPREDGSKSEAVGIEFSQRRLIDQAGAVEALDHTVRGRRNLTAVGLLLRLGHDRSPRRIHAGPRASP